MNLSQRDKPPGGDVLIFHCRSRARTKGNAPRLAAAAPKCKSYILEGGIDAWKKAGLPVALDRSQPIDLLRQMQITAGSLALLGILLGTWVNPGFYALSAFIGARRLRVDRPLEKKFISARRFHISTSAISFAHDPEKWEPV